MRSIDHLLSKTSFVCTGFDWREFRDLIPPRLARYRPAGHYVSRRNGNPMPTGLAVERNSSLGRVRYGVCYDAWSGEVEGLAFVLQLSATKALLGETEC